MRSQFKGHFGEPKEVVDELWQSATFVFDANVLLNLYRYSDKARSEFLRLLKLSTIQERCWLPEQCVHEFLSNRLSVVRDQMKAYSDTTKSIGAIKDTFAGSKGHPFISEKSFDDLSSILGKINRELTKNGRSQEGRLTKDDVKEEIANIFEGKVGPKLSDKDMDALFVEAETRYGEEIPPGYKDGNKHPNAKRRTEKRSNFGDFILWRQTLDLAKSESKDVILVTDDQKEDWWLLASGKTISARPELIAEFCEYTGQRVLIYTPNRFLQLAEEKLGAKVSENTIDEIRQEHDARFLSRLAERKARDLERESIIRRNKARAREMELDREKFEQKLLFDPSYDEYHRNNVGASDEKRRRSLMQVLKDELVMIAERQTSLDQMIEHRKVSGDVSDTQDLLLQKAQLQSEKRAIQHRLRDLYERDI